MFESKDYATLTLDELLIEEKKIKKNETTSTLIIGFLIGVMIYGLVKGNMSFFFIIIQLFLIGGVYKNSQKNQENLKKIQAEIDAKNPA